MPSTKGNKNGKDIKTDSESPEHILRALNSLSTPEEKLAALCKKYADIHEEHRSLSAKFKTGQKKLTAVIREKDQLQTDHSKTILAKSKLESLCRELQKHNKLVKEESLATAREEEEKRKEVTGKFQNTIGDIQKQMNDHYTKNTKLREENIELANKLKGLMEQYELREQHVEKLIKHKELEQQLVEAQLAQANLQLTEEKEKGLVQKQILLKDSAEAHTKIKQLEQQKNQLQVQLQVYTEKYEEFQSTLTKSNEVFQSFKSEIEKMTKKIKKLEKETLMWKTRWGNSNKTLLEMAECKTKSDQEIKQLKSKIQKLENLCRALQRERNTGIPCTIEATEEISQENKPVSEDSNENTKPSETQENVVPSEAGENTVPSETEANTRKGEEQGTVVPCESSPEEKIPDESKDCSAPDSAGCIDTPASLEVPPSSANQPGPASSHEVPPVSSDQSQLSDDKSNKSAEAPKDETNPDSTNN